MDKGKSVFGILFGVVFAFVLIFFAYVKLSDANNVSDNLSINSGVSEKKEVEIVALKGPTSMGLVNLMDRSERGEISSYDYKFTVVSSVDEIIPKISNDQVDIAMIPANLSSVLYNNVSGGVSVIAINTLGVLYILEHGDTVKNIGDLRGKTIYASGKGATPEYALNYILQNNGIDPSSDVSIEWKSEHSECLSSLLTGENSVAMLPQPFVASAKAKSDKITEVIDLNSEWDKIQEKSDSDSALVTGVAVVKKNFAESNRDAVIKFLDYYRESVDFVNNNLEQASELIEKYGIVTKEIAFGAIPRCNIRFIEGNSMKVALSGYLDVLFQQNPKSVGGKLPEDDFYFQR